MKDPAPNVTELDAQRDLVLWEQKIKARQAQFREVKKWMDRADFYRRHPELVNHLYTSVGLPAFVAVEPVVGIEDHEARTRVEQRRRVRAQVRVLRDAGATVHKRFDGTGDLRIGAEVDGQPIGEWVWGWCHEEPSGETERVEALEVPDEIAKAYTVVKQVPVMKRVCTPIFGEEDDL